MVLCRRGGAGGVRLSVGEGHAHEVRAVHRKGSMKPWTTVLPQCKRLVHGRLRAQPKLLLSSLSLLARLALAGQPCPPDARARRAERGRHVATDGRTR